MKVAPANRNDPCPCGSGKKFKNCCALKMTTKLPPSRRSQVPFYLLMLVMAGAAIAGFQAWTRPAPTPPPPFAPTPASANTPAPPLPGAVAQKDPVTGLYPQPPGPVPEGKVWSPEHGHWHNLVANATPGQPMQAASLQPQPPGPVPEGKVWSPEHGHWHNAAGTTPTPNQVLPSQRLPPYSVAMARKIQETYRTYDLPVTAELQTFLPPPPLP